ncbi:nickel pincer cofactor biosynthesis protein LarC [Clostridium fallax]|uniref:Pyridinium-3,5-bisthiocarboxylic acid mononucleotide nickel insertion protein n=1 Tax=Clostridium fallax TaxID=1533 RepID=A0A1M4ZI79_9CLOT|nr:nickel pincer cofactor biosynthesis protein LarC [Clostridium fallax]SHF17507.1 hypothetical protein SAMN05443638_1482 [Clostridium fallax]SQB06466.1 TIGR00299 family protein [Clostridium fallax]
MKVLYYDCFSGISGDMNLGALIDLGIPYNHLTSELDKLNIKNEFEIYIEKAIKGGITGTKVNIIDSNNKDHTHCHNHHHHHHRSYKDIKDIILNSSLSESIKNLSIKIFDKVAISESKIHNKSLEEVHFHEVGAIDSIVDIVGCAICIDFLKVDLIISSPIEIGYGTLKCAHGILPVPAPATAEILKGVPVIAKNVSFEATTPTGAAIIKSIATNFTYKKDFTIEGIGYGIGDRENPIAPNVLRVLLGEKNNFTTSKEYIVECNIDDMRGEEFELLMERLFEKGAFDVFYTPIFMKKERPGVKVSVICNEENLKNIKEVIFINSSTIGIRQHEVHRDKLSRIEKNVNCKFGNIPSKISFYDNKEVNMKPDYDVCKEIAKINNISISEVFHEVIYSYLTSKKDNNKDE